MSKPKNPLVFTPVGIAVYPRLTGDEADTKFDSAGVWHTKMAYQPEELEEFIEKLNAQRDEFFEQILEENKRKYAKYQKVEVFEEELDDDGEPTGRLIIKAKMRHHVVTKQGKEWWQTPRIFDSSAPPKELDQETLRLWGGSKIRLQCEAVPYAMDSSKTVGISLRLRAVQVVELVSGGGGESPFDGFEGGFTADTEESDDDSPFDPDEAADGGDDEDGDY